MHTSTSNLDPAPDPSATPSFDERMRVARRTQCEQTLIEQVGLRHHDCRFSNYSPQHPSQTQALEIVRNDWWHQSRFLLLTGDPGVGKTHLAVASYRAFQWNYGDWDLRPVFVSEPDFLHEWRNAAANHRKFTGFERARTNCLLVLDDVGTGRYTDGSLELVFQIIDYRYRHELPTILTSNASFGELDTRLGEKIVSRIVDRDISRVVRIDGPNRRLRS